MYIKYTRPEDVGMSFPTGGLVPLKLASRCHHKTEHLCPGAVQHHSLILHALASSWLAETSLQHLSVYFVACSRCGLTEWFKV